MARWVSTCSVWLRSWVQVHTYTNTQTRTKMLTGTCLPIPGLHPSTCSLEHHSRKNEPPEAARKKLRAQGRYQLQLHDFIFRSHGAAKMPPALTRLLGKGMRSKVKSHDGKGSSCPDTPSLGILELKSTQAAGSA